MNSLTDRREEEKERRRDEILDAAEFVFSTEGFELATMAQVAKRARVSRALVYVYFKDKTALHLEICVRGLRTLRDMFQKAREAHQTGYQQVRAMGLSYLQFAELHPTYFAAMSKFEAQIQPCSALPEADDQTMNMLMAGRRVHEELVLGLAQGISDGTLRSDLTNLMQISITLWAFSHGTIQLAQTKQTFMNSMGIDKAKFMTDAVDLSMRALSSNHLGGTP